MKDQIYNHKIIIDKLKIIIIVKLKVKNTITYILQIRLHKTNFFTDFRIASYIYFYVVSK